MKLLNMINMLILLAVILFAVGCAGTPIKIGVVDGLLDKQKFDFSKGRQVSGAASGFQLLLFIPVNINDRHEKAFNQMMAKAGSDYVTDVRIKESWKYAFVGTIYETEIEATAYPYKDGK